MELLLLFLSIAILVLPLQSSNTMDIQVGVVLDSDSPVGHIGKCCLPSARSDFYSSHSDYKTRLVLNYRDSNGSVVGAAASGMFYAATSYFSLTTFQYFNGNTLHF